jgi:glycosyltransferase involved in cell wall biosynthesis
VNRLSVCLITLNEEQDLARALASLRDVADEIVVVDSGSKDRTCEIAAEFGARVFNRAWTNYSDQRNFAAAQASSDWIVALDADEELSPTLLESLRAWKKNVPAEVAYAVARKANYLGGWIHHSGWYPDLQVRLYRRDLVQFKGTVHESLQVSGPIGRLQGDLYHYTVSTLDEHAAKVENYTTLAAQQLFEAGRRSWLVPMVLAPLWTFLQKLLLRAGILDGYRGWLIAWMSARYVFLKYHKLGRLTRAAHRK